MSKAQNVTRKLRAILSMDVKGYSLLMADNEVHTIQTLKAYRQIIADQIHQHSGRVVDSPGDNLLAEFESAVDAVECAVDVQKRLKKENDRFVEDKRLQFRIGVNIGDVVRDGDQIYGSGINVAARIEGIADPGGVCISHNTYDHVKGKLEFGFMNLGEHEVKNIKNPVRVYKVMLESDSPTPLVGGVLELPDKPSIAVLPFDNMSGDPEQEYFSDGITEDLITDLSKISGLFVIARNSTFAYKGKPFKIKDVERDLGVHYVLEGSVRRANNRVRITAQLIDAHSEGHLWAERYDRDLKDIFSLQDEVTQKIITALMVRLTDDEQKRLIKKETTGVDAYDYVLRGLAYINRFTKEANALAKKMFLKAIEFDPEYASAYSGLGRAHWMEWVFGWSQDPQILKRTHDVARKALSLDKSNSLGHSLLGDVYLWGKKHDKAITEMEETLALNPNDADGLSTLGGILSWADKADEAEKFIKMAMRLNPIHPVWYLWNLGHVYFLLGQLVEAKKQFKKAVNQNPDYLPAHIYLAAIYSELDQQEDAQNEAMEIERLSPQTPVEIWRHKIPYKDESKSDRLIKDLYKAGCSVSKKII